MIIINKIYYGSGIWSPAIQHQGVKGMKWGIRRYRNEDGSLTPEGKAKYANKITRADKLTARYKEKGLSESESRSKAERRVKIEKAAIASIAVAGSLSLAYINRGAIVKAGRKVARRISGNKSFKSHAVRAVHSYGIDSSSYKKEPFFNREHVRAMNLQNMKPLSFRNELLLQEANNERLRRRVTDALFR